MSRIAALMALGQPAIKSLKALIGALLILGAAPAFAGDRAQLDTLGYSPDGQYFAFEEFGISDGSGFAYSVIYLLDLSTDNWVSGSPFRQISSDETTALAQIRADNLAAAQPQLHDFGIEKPAQILALIGDGSIDNPATDLRFGLPQYVNPGAVVGDYRLKLSSFIAPAVAPCSDWFEGDTLGYQLDFTANGAATMLHRDVSLPRSRACPIAYRLYGVLAPYDARDLQHGVAIISVFSHGFEGPNRRFIAIPVSTK